MKNRIKKYNKNDKQNADDLIKEILKRQEKIFDDRRDHFVEAIGKIPLTPDGNYDSERIDIVDINNMRAFHALIRKEDFSEQDIDGLMSLMPSMIAIKKDGTPFTPLDHALHIAESIGSLPVDIYIHKHHAKKGEEKDNAVESIKLANILLDKSLSIADEEIKVLTTTDLLMSLSYLDKIKERLTFQGFDFFYDEAGNYTEKERKEAEATFKRRNELPKDNPYRQDFVTQYIDDEVYNRFYNGKNEVKYTAELGKEWDRHFNALCDEHKEQEYKRDFSDAFYRGLEANRVTGEVKDDFLLCHYPLSPNDETQDAELQETARRYGIEPSLINKALRLKAEHYKIIEQRYRETTP